jgi:hypothetical protein
MEEIIYITPNGSEVDELTLRNKYGERFDQLVLDKVLKKKDSLEITTDSELETGISDLPEPKISQEEKTFFDALLPETEVADFMGDMLINVRQGLAQGASINDALKVMRQGSDASDEDIQNYINAVTRMQSMPMTDEMRDFARIYEADENKFRGFIKGLAANPSVIPGIVAQSVSNMANLSTLFGGIKGVGAGATAGSVVPILGTAAGAVYGGIAGLTNTLEKGLSFTEFLQEEIDKKGLQFNDEGIKAVLDDPEAISRVKRRTVARGATISTVNALTAGVAGQSARAARQLAKLPKTAARAARTTTEMVGGGLGEAAGRAVAGQEMDVAEIGFEALGELGAPETLFSLTPTRKPTGDIQSSVKIASYKINNEPVNKSDIEDILNSGDLEAISKITYEITNDPELSNKIEQARADAIVANDIKKAFPTGTKIDDTSLNKLVTLQKELTSLRDNPTEIAKDRIPEIELQIKNIKDAIQKPSPEKVDVQEPAPDSEAVGARDIQQQPVTGEVTPEQVEAEAKPTEEIEAEVEVTPSEVETYTLPENPIEAKKDFEIIDNRNKKAGLEINEEGDGKYYVENIKTGKIVAVKTKKEAQETIQNPKSFDYGEGQPVLEEFRTKVTEEVIESPIEAAPTDKVRQIGNFEVIFTEDNVIKSIKKNGKEVSGQGRRNAEKQIIQAGEIDVTKGKKAQLDKGMSPTEVSEVILRESSNPSEIATEIALIKENKKNKKRSLQERKQSGLPSLFGTKFTPESIINVFGVKPSELGQGFTRTWVSKTGENLNDGFIDPNGIKFDKDQVAEFLQQNPSEAQYNREFLNKLPQLQKDLENKFEEITGITTTEGNIQLASSPEKIAEVAEKTIFEAEREAEKKPIFEPETLKEKVKKPSKDKEVIQADVNELSKPVNRITKKILDTNFGNFYAKTKNIFAKGKGVVNVLQEQIRSTPTPKVDYVLGNENSTLFYRKLFLPLVKSYQKYADNFRVKEKKILEAEDKLLSESKGDRNKAIINSYKISIAQKALENESNPDSKVTPPVLELLNKTIELAEDGDILNPIAAKELTKLRDSYLKNGEIKFIDVYNSLSKTQKKVFKTLQDEYKDLENFAVKAAERRGESLDLIKDYSHRIVLGEREDKVDILKEADIFSDPSTRSVTTFERTEELKPVSFDPFISSLRAIQETYLDYYISPSADKVQDISSALKNKYKKGNKGQKAATTALDKTLKELLRVTYLRSFIQTNNKTNLLTEAKRIGYRLLLASAPRFAAELAGNSAMLLAEKPSVVKNAITKYGKFSLAIGNDANNKFIGALRELNSGETDKLGGRLAADTKYTDTSGILNIQANRRNLYNNTLNKMQYLKGIKKYTYDAIAKGSDFLMGGSDRAIARPIWISKFAEQFISNVKKYNNENIDITVEELNKIADGKSIYLEDKYKRAREEAVNEADRTTINITTSVNPFNAIAKNVKRGDVKDYYRTINSFMANFTLNEYATARFAIGALRRSGEISTKEASLLLAGVLARMSSYVVILNYLSDGLDEMFGAPEDNEDELENVIKRQLIGSIMTLMFRQNLGNIPSLPINLGIEKINQKYLEKLRDGKPYESYENSIVYSLIALDKLGQKSIGEQVLPVLAGPFVEYYKTLDRATKLLYRAQTRKTEEARQKAKDEFNEVMIFQIIGQLGLMPFYKDVVRFKRKKFFDDQSSSSSGRSTPLPSN